MKIAVYDSGLGSLSIIKELQKQIPSAKLIYLADRKHFPYGKKSHEELKEIIIKTNEFLIKNFSPDIIIIASNTPSIQILPELKDTFTLPIIGVFPPIEAAARYSKTKHIAILATDNTVNSFELNNFVKNAHLNSQINVTLFGISTLVDLVESGEFLTDPKKTTKIIKHHLKPLTEQLPPIDAMTLSSTHLPFLIDYFKREFPRVKFFNPADNVAKEVKQLIKASNKLPCKIEIYVSSDLKFYQTTIKNLGFTSHIQKIKLNF